jgi:hypothetical protein
VRERVRAIQPDRRAANGKRHLRQRQPRAIEHEAAGQVRGHVVHRQVRRPPAPSTAQFVDLVLHLAAGKTCRLDEELPLQVQASRNRLIARRQFEVRLELEPTAHLRRLRVERQSQHVLDVPVVDRDVQRDRASLLTWPMDDAARGSEVRPPKRGAHRIEQRVAVGAVHDRGEDGVERHRLAADVEREIWRRAGAVHRDALEHAGEVSVGIEFSSQPLDAIQIGIGEGVAPRQPRQRRFVGIPGPERPYREDRPLGDRVGQVGVVGDRAIECCRGQHQIVNEERSRWPTRFS